MNSEKYIIKRKIDLVNPIPLAHEQTSFLLNDDELNFVRNINHKLNKTNGLSNNKLVLNDNRLKRVRDFINSRVFNYIDKVVQIEDKFKLTQSWTTLSKKDEFHHHHTHPNTIFSAVYYAQTESGQLEFVFEPRMREGFNFSYKIKEYNPFNSLSWTFEVKTGDVVIFPGWILHGTTRNESDIDRIVIGANYFINGTVGTEDGVDLIEI